MPATFNATQFSARLVRLRHQKGWRQTDLAKNLACTRAFTSHLQLGIKQPSASLMDRMAQAFDLTPPKNCVRHPTLATPVSNSHPACRIQYGVPSITFPTSMQMPARDAGIFWSKS